MSWILDVLIIVIFLGTVIKYTCQGFVKSFLDFGRTLIAAFLAWLFGPKLAVVIAEKVIGNRIKQKTYNILASSFEGASDKFNLAQLFEQAPDGFIRLVERLGGNISELEAKYGHMTEASREDLVELSHSIAQPITNIISTLFGYLIIFLVASLCFAILSKLITKIFELPVLKQFNRLLGFILGLIFGAMNTLIFCFFATYLLPFIAAITAAFVAEDLIAGTTIFQVIAQIKLF